MLKSFCFCSGQYCTNSSSSILNNKIIQHQNSFKKQDCIDQKYNNKFKYIHNSEEYSIGFGSNLSEHYKSNTDDSYSTGQSYSTNPSSITNSIHFYHPKSINSNRQVEMSDKKKITNIISANYMSTSQDTSSVMTTSSSLNSSKIYSEGLESPRSKINNYITSTAMINLKPNLPLSQPPPLLSSDKYSSSDSSQFLKNIHSSQFLSIRRRFSNNDISDANKKFDKPNYVSLKSLDKSENLEDKTNVNIYESINSSNNNLVDKDIQEESNQVISSLNKPDDTLEIVSKFEFDKHPDKTSNLSQLDETQSKVTECSHHVVKSNLDENLESPTSIKESEEPVANVQETYNNNISGYEIPYISGKQELSTTIATTSLNTTDAAKTKSELFILIDKKDSLKKLNEIKCENANKDKVKSKNIFTSNKKSIDSNSLDTENANILVKNKLISNIKKKSKVNIKNRNENKNQEISIKPSEIIKSIENNNTKFRNSCNHRHSHSCHTHKTDKKLDQAQAQSSVNEVKMATDLEKLISRLETVTNRLESVSGRVSTSAPGVQAQQTNGISHSKANGTSAEHDTTEELPSIVAFDDLFNTTFKSFKELSVKVGLDIRTIVDLVEKVFKYERSFLVEAARSSQPSQDILMKFFELFSKHIQEVQAFREKNRQSVFFNHLSAISESIGAFGWIAISPAPSPYVKEMSDSAQFYTNRVLKDYKEKDPNHVNWVKQWLQLLSELQAYVKQHHTTGVSWNTTKKSLQFDPSRVSVSGSGPAPSSAPPSGGPNVPPPPPPPMPNFAELLADDNSSSRTGGLKTDALFADINKGNDITKGLKKVSDDQKTHKNPALKAGNVVPATVASATSSSSSFQSKTAVQKPPVFELQDRKWKIEFQTNRNDLVIEETDLKQTVYIYQCKECTITVKGKVNSISIDSCSRVGLLFDDVLSTVEFVNSKSVQMQVLGKVPTVSIEKTDGCQVYLSKNSLATEIVSSKSSSMNILVPNEHDDEYTEHPVPEQFKTLINKSRKLTTTPSEAV